MGLNLINASNGSGEAVRASVTGIRAPGATTLSVDALTNWPTSFIATSGQLLSDGTLDPSTVLVFAGHIGTSNIVIDEFAPGYTDIGNSVGDVVLIKPTTYWADTIAEFLGVSLDDLGNIKQAYDAEPGLKFSVADTQPDPDPDGAIIVWFEPTE